MAYKPRPSSYTWNRFQSPQRALGPRETPNKIDALKCWLSDYPKHDDVVVFYIIEDFSEGFQLQYSGPRIPMYSKNLKSAILDQDALNETLY